MMEFKMKEVGFSTDLPFGSLQVAGNEEYGYRPYQLMVASIAVCSGGVLRQVLTKMRLEYEDIRIQADVERNEKEANKIEKVLIHFQIKGNDLTQNKIHKALELTRKNCSMVQSVMGSIDVVETFEIL